MSRVSISDRPGFGGLSTLCTDEVSLYRGVALPCGGVLPFFGEGALGQCSAGEICVGCLFEWPTCKLSFCFCFF